MKFIDSAYFDDDELDINITPLIDIVFLLLIFFMVSTTFVESAGINVSLPSAQSAPVKKEGTPVLISIGKDGAIYMAERKLSFAELEARLREQLAAGAEAALVVRADRAAQHGIVVKVMDAARAAGITKLAVAVSPEQQ